MARQLFLTVCILMGSFLVFEFSNLDINIQNHFYDFDLDTWVLDRNDRLARFIFYDGVKALFVVGVLLMIMALLLFRNSKIIKEYKQGLIIVCLATLLVPSVIGILKAYTNVPCPKDIVHFGGSYPYVTVLSNYPKSFIQSKNIECYPAGHASGGFSLMALFFLFKSKRNKVIALGLSTTIGWSTGLYKMLIGDHFLGHTVITMILAWCLILVLAMFVLRKSGTLDNPISITQS